MPCFNSVPLSGAISCRFIIIWRVFLFYKSVGQEPHPKNAQKIYLTRFIFVFCFSLAFLDVISCHFLLYSVAAPRVVLRCPTSACANLKLPAQVVPQPDDHLPRVRPASAPQMPGPAVEGRRAPQLHQPAVQEKYRHALGWAGGCETRQKAHLLQVVSVYLYFD